MICLAIFIAITLAYAHNLGQARWWGLYALLVVLLAMLANSPAHAQVPPGAARYRTTLAREAQLQWGLGAPIPALAAQVHQESGWRADAVSRVGARGMAQFMPATARWWCDYTGVATRDCLPHNPTWALRALVGYDVYLYKRVPPRFSNYDRLWLALRGYNGGEGNWQTEARTTGLAQPTRAQIDAACGRARRAALHCAENLGYPRRILAVLQPRYAAWGPVWQPAAAPAGRGVLKW
jgi:soluble lytic murein transglycosylase-like protein